MYVPVYVRFTSCEIKGDSKPPTLPAIEQPDSAAVRSDVG